MTSVLGTQCSRCSNQFARRLACPAYPDGIPTDVLRNERLHLRVFGDQRGVEIYRPDGKKPEWVPPAEGG